MANRRLLDLADYMRARVGVQVLCLQCGHKGVLNPTTLLMQCVRSQKGYRMFEVQRRLRCAECGARKVKVIPQLGQ
jgi:hypothetical protein